MFDGSKFADTSSLNPIISKDNSAINMLGNHEKIVTAFLVTFFLNL